ncbi:MAG: helix-turn-helix transcriptional regulator [Rhodothermaceae bacterium]|nr:helix-turn-helix transcriptional regulator [Rhodothermaceae bacterium]
MSLNLSPLELIATLVAGGTVVLAFGVGMTLLVRRSGRTWATVFLGLFLIAGGLTLLNELLNNLALYRLHPHFYLTPLLYTYALGPLLYFFVRYRLDPARSFRRADAWHAVLPGLQAVQQLVTGLGPLALKDWYWQTPLAQVWGALDVPIFALSFGFYLVLSWRALDRADGDYPWLRRLVVGSAIILAVTLVFNAARRIAWAREVDLDANEWVPLVEELVYAALLYWVALTGWLQANAPYPPKRQERYNLKAEELAQHLDSLNRLMADERPYLNPNLTLGTLADRLGLTPQVVSYVINEGKGQSYPEYVNGLRVDEVRRRLADEESAALTLLSIGLDAGFPSKATFNRVFKQTTGLTPSEYRRGHVARVS